MDLESEDEDKENEESGENGVEEEVDDEKNTSHCMEELWEGGKILISAVELKLRLFYRRSPASSRAPRRMFARAAGVYCQC